MSTRKTLEKLPPQFVGDAPTADAELADAGEEDPDDDDDDLTIVTPFLLGQMIFASATGHTRGPPQVRRGPQQHAHRQQRPLRKQRRTMRNTMGVSQWRQSMSSSGSSDSSTWSVLADHGLKSEQTLRHSAQNTKNMGTITSWKGSKRGHCGADKDEGAPISCHSLPFVCVMRLRCSVHKIFSIVLLWK